MPGFAPPLRSWVSHGRAWFQGRPCPCRDGARSGLGKPTATDGLRTAALLREGSASARRAARCHPRPAMAAGSGTRRHWMGVAPSTTQSHESPPCRETGRGSAEFTGARQPTAAGSTCMSETTPAHECRRELEFSANTCVIYSNAERATCHAGSIRCRTYSVPRFHGTLHPQHLHTSPLPPTPRRTSRHINGIYLPDSSRALPVFYIVHRIMRQAWGRCAVWQGSLADRPGRQLKQPAL